MKPWRRPDGGFGCDLGLDAEEGWEAKKRCGEGVWVGMALRTLKKYVRRVR